jgi:hypothetical protein
MSDLADLALLQALDDPYHVEQPADFDWRAADDRFREMAADIARALGEDSLEQEGVESIQNASFHGLVVLPARALRMGELEGAVLYASNFGHLAAVRPETAVAASALQAIRTVLHDRGYTYVPASLQDTSYSGRTALDQTAPTWWTRYFEYQF